MPRSLSTDYQDSSSSSLVGRLVRYRRPSNASQQTSSLSSTSPYQHNSFSPQLSKHAHLSPQETRYIFESASSEASASPRSSNAVSPYINYDRELPQLPPDAFVHLDTNQLASQHLARTDDEVRSRHLSQYESLHVLSSPTLVKPESTSKPSAAFRFATASTSAAVSAAGSGLRKLGKKASAARLRRPNTTAQQTAELDTSYAAIRSSCSPQSFASDAVSVDHIGSIPSSSTTYDSTHARQPRQPRLPQSASSINGPFVDAADPQIGLPYHVSHNVHVDIGPHGYTGLPSSWAHVLLSEGMDSQDIYDHPHAAARLVQDKTEYYVQRAVDNGVDAGDARRILSQTLAQDQSLSAILASAAPSRSTRPNRDSVQSSASSSYSSVLEKGWDLGSPPKTDHPAKFSLLPTKSPLLPDFAAQDFDEWSTELLSSIPSTANDNKINSSQLSKQNTHKAARRRSKSLSQIPAHNPLSGLGLGIGIENCAHATPKHNVQRTRDLLSAADATPKASSQRMNASLGLSAPAAAAAAAARSDAYEKHQQSISVEDELQERLRESLDWPEQASTHLQDEEAAEVEHVQIAQAAIVTKGVLRPFRTSQLSARKVSPSSTGFDHSHAQISPSSSASDVQVLLSASPRHRDGFRSPSSLSDRSMSRAGSADSYATAGSRPALATRTSFFNVPPRILTKDTSTYAESVMTDSPVETSSSGHSSMRLRSPSLTVATSSMGHGNGAAILQRASPSPSRSVRDTASPEMPSKNGDWRSRSPALSISAYDAPEGASSPSGAQHAMRHANQGPASLDGGYTVGQKTRDSWASTTPSITSSDGTHSVVRGLALRERRQAPPRIYPPSTSTRWAHISHQDDISSPMGLGSAGSNRRMQLSPSPTTIQAPMQRKTSADSLASRPDRSPMSDHSHRSKSSVQSGFRRRESELVSQSSHERCSVRNSTRDSMVPPPLPPKPTRGVLRKQTEYIMPGVDGFYTMPLNNAAPGRSDAGSIGHASGPERLRPPPRSPALSPASSTDASDYHAAIDEWMRDDQFDRSPATTTFCEPFLSPSFSSRDSPLPPLMKEEIERHEEAIEPQLSSPYLQRRAQMASASSSKKHLASPPTSESSCQRTADTIARKPGSDNGWPVPERSPRLASLYAPSLELSAALANISSLTVAMPSSPAGTVEVIDDPPSEVSDENDAEARLARRTGEELAESTGRAELARHGGRDRDVTQSIISIGPRAQEDARRFPVSMHYASGFESASMLGDDLEAMRSFRELMLARQSMDLEEMLTMPMGVASAPPVPALPSMRELQAKVAAAEQIRGQDAAQTKLGEQQAPLASPTNLTVSSAASPSVSQFELDCDVDALPAKLSHLRDAIQLQALRKDVLCNLQMIGDGESGPVFAAHDVVKKRRVAIKVVRFASDRDEEPSARLLGLGKEVGIWRRCRHVNVLDLYSTVLTNEAIWMVHELAERSLADVIAWKDAGVDLNESRMSRIMGDLVEALQFLHAKRVLHRDVRSDNVMISSTGVCKLGDFTHAGELSAGVSTRHSVVGTPYWMAPEVIKAHKYDMRCDVWSLGVVLWEMIEGDPPRVEFPPLRAITLTATLGLPALRHAASLSHELKSFLHWATEMDAEKRPSAEMLAMSDFLADPCSRASMVAMLEEARNAEFEGNRHEAEQQTAEAKKRRVEPSGDAGRIKDALRHRESWSSDTTTKG
ncbi:uncharacterized protein UMAG_05014 [Mycosarcoma maydis]|uniref:Protein kinase domain-containing protein n=1 Tax=Mycosarcoma maydis TaxID=5270 RepID=A0A0D1BZL7_MYCMD|nr:uncharacterized protein UMAG_05014 [Ustilago maydis 521]KIS67147.1 hypothetical protein UMAG_05014 [Ustilago maydis 521]|eukprot:XP_011391308.1 hypothetical protein UMAG_05014 [Ustilago maydis 521]